MRDYLNEVVLWGSVYLSCMNTCAKQKLGTQEQNEHNEVWDMLNGRACSVDLMVLDFIVFLIQGLCS